MIPRVLIDTAAIPGGGSLRLIQRGDEFSIMSGPIELMNSRLSGSEEALATLAAERMRHLTAPRILIGGLGMGFTLRAALAAFGPQAAITVVELVPAVIAWARGPMAALFAGSLDDPRVTLREADVGAVIGADKTAWDAILLDVDNGPEGLMRTDNDALYAYRGLGLTRDALRPGGVLAVWSSGVDGDFTQRLKDSGFAVQQVAARASVKRRGARHTIWLATPAAGAEVRPQRRSKAARPGVARRPRSRSSS
jgi:spermidine synthase